MRTEVILLIFFLVFSRLNSYGQYLVKGTVNDINKSSIEGFNATILNPNDSTLIKGGFFVNGEFELTCKEKQILIYLSSLGYRDTILPVTIVDAEKLLPNICLKKQSIELNDITVNAKRQLYTQTPDKLILNVDKTILKESGDATDVLKKSVKLNVDSDNNITVLGRGNAYVYLNGKKISSNEILTMIPSEEIKSVEIIDNPSAQYEAEAQAVVNIITKKSGNFGSGAKIINSTTKRNSFENSTNIQFSNRSPKNNFYASYYFLTKQRKYDNEYIRDYSQTDLPSVILNKIDEKFSVNQQHSLRLNDELNISKTNTLGIVFNTSYYDGKLKTDNQNQIFDDIEFGNLKEEFSSDINSILERSLINGQINYTIKPKKKGTEWQFSIERYYYHAEKNESILETSGNSLVSKSNGIDNKFNFHTLQADYNSPLTNSWKLQSGVRYSKFKNESKTIYNTPVSSRNEAFDNQESEFAAYNVLKYKHNKLSVNIGVRLEYLNRDTKLEELMIVDKESWEWLPSFLISKRLNDKTQLSLTYNKKIVRPSFQDLNPTINYIDSLSYTQGNPELINAKIDNFDLKFSYMKYASISLFYKKTKDAIVWDIESPEENTQIAIGTQKNIESQNSWGVNLVLPYQTKTYTIYVASGFEQVNNTGEYSDLNKFKWYLKSGIDLNLPFDLKSNLTGLYFSDGINGIWTYDDAYKIDASLQKSFANDKLNISLSFEDIFRSNKMKSQAEFDNRIVKYNYYYDDSFIRLRVSYNFSKIKKRPRSNSLLKEQRDRIKSMYK